jgi:aspartate kinase
MAKQSGVADRMFRALAESNINIEAITTSDIKVSVLVKREKGVEALRAVHGEFELEKPPGERVAFAAPTGGASVADALAVVRRLQAMEDLTIHGVSLDESQCRVTLFDVPDRPGISADVFEAVAAENIIVDMIVQGVGADGLASLSFTAPQRDFSKSRQVVEELAKQYGGEVAAQPQVAILTVNGVGIRSHTGVGIRLFKALAEAGINVEMVSTSEMKVNVVVNHEQAAAGLAALKSAFADVGN